MRENRLFSIKNSKIIFLMILFSSFVVFQFSGRTWFLYLQIVFCLIMAVSGKKIALLPFPIVNLIFLELILCVISGICSNTSASYKKAAIVMVIFMVPMYFAASYCYILIKRNDKILSVIVKAFKTMCLIQLLIIPIQYIMYHLFGIDINKLIFVNTLHFLDNASFFRDWVYYPSGLTWHSAVLAPMLVISFFLFERLSLRILIIIDSIICGNSTALAGVIICCILYGSFLIFDKHKSKKHKIRAGSIIVAVVLIMVIMFLFYRFALAQILGDRILYLFKRLFGSETDASTSAHFQYFADYFIIVKRSSLLQILFGYGEGCSGYYISQMYNRYTSIGNWAIECDIVNIAINRGIVGFVLYYILLFELVIKGYKKDKRYFITMVCIIIQGFGYNVQWDYVLFMELILYFTLKLNLNFFDYGKVIYE